MTQQKILNLEDTKLTLSSYRKKGGYEVFLQSLKGQGAKIIDSIERAQMVSFAEGLPFLSDRLKKIASEKATKKYLFCHAVDVLPGASKKRHLTEHYAHNVLEGILLTAFALGVDQGYICINGRHRDSIAAVAKALQEAKNEGFIGRKIKGFDFHCEIEILPMPDHPLLYVDRALLSCVDNHIPLPFGDEAIEVCGHRQLPTIVMGVEDFLYLPKVLQMGGREFRQIGNQVAAGSILTQVLGDVHSPGIYEIPFGTPLSLILDSYGGGLRRGNRLKGVLPGGIISKFLSAKEAQNFHFDPQSAQKYQSEIWPGSIIFFDESRKIEDIVRWCLNFFVKGSCGKCQPCFNGFAIIDELTKSEGGQGERTYAETEYFLQQMKDINLCEYPNTVLTVFQSLCEKKKYEYEN